MRTIFSVSRGQAHIESIANSREDMISMVAALSHGIDCLFP
jgi:hypothetical protein